MSAKLYFFMIVVHGLSVLVHWAMWRWLRSTAPSFAARHRKPILLAMAVLVMLSFGRELSYFWPDFAPFAIAGAVGALWNLTAWMGMAVVGILRIGRRFARTALPDHSSERREALERIGAAVAFTASGTALGWGAVRGRFDWAIEEVPIRLERLPKALDGFTIVQLSDLHIGTFVGERELEAGLSLVDQVRADLIVITGDIVDMDPRYVPLAARRLGALRAREGVACIPGNHDYYTGAAAVLDGMRRAGIDVLFNRGRVIAGADGGFALLGVDDLWARDNVGGHGPDLGRALSMVRPDLATVLLAHQPRFAEVASKSGIDLQLSGHTHGGQINPGFRPLDLFVRYVAGRYDVGRTQLYVNRGFGTVGPPTRVGARPEITKLVLVAG
jgi:predicted MPP superfamily phosphohydrolase